MSLAYSIREGLSGFQRAKFAAMASTSAITVALALIGAIGLVGYHVDRISTYMKAQTGEVEVFLREIDEKETQALERRLAGLPGIAETHYISQEEAEAIFREEFGEEGDVFMGGSFLPASFKIRMSPDYANVDSLTLLTETIAGWDNVDEVVFNLPLLVRVQENLRLATALALTVGLMVVLASLFLVANTIRLTIYARRLLIRTMKLVGATNRFIRRPFLFEGLFQGFLGGLTAGLLVLGVHYLLMRYMPLLEAQGWPGGHPIYTIGVLTLLGMFLGWLGSMVAARRFIRNVQLH